MSDLMEYMGKQLFARYGIPVSDGGAAKTVDEAVEIAERVGYPVVVKAQVLIGGRGKQGGVKLANNLEELKMHAENILKLTIYDRTGTIGYPVHVIWIEKASDIADVLDAAGNPVLDEKGNPKKEEYYASITLDRSKKKHLGMLSAQGGVEIEDVAVKDPDAISKIWIDPAVGLSEDALRAWVKGAKLNPKAEEGAIDILRKLYDVYTKGDAALAEINPLILTPDGKVHALDAKVTLDEAAAYRHPEWAEFEGLESGDERERAAAEKDLQYVGLEGSVGIIANGAGLAMSTVDIITQVNGKAANFLDIGGGADANRMVDALTVINSDPAVKVIFINIFGGITRCDDVANGIVQAKARVNLRAPLVVRLDGTNAVLGRQILVDNASDTLIMKPDMLSAAKAAVEIAGRD